MPYSQTIDADVRFRTRETVVEGEMTEGERALSVGRPPELVELESVMAIKKVKVERTLAGMGSTTTVEAAVPRETNTKILEAGTTPEFAIDIELDLAVDFDTGERFQERVFTGTLQKATIDEEQTLTLKFMDRRDLFNRYRVHIDTRDDGETTVAIVRNLLGQDIGLEEGEDFLIDITDPEDVYAGYGVDSMEPVGNVLRDLANQQGAALWIDEYNRIHFEDFESRSAFTPLGVISYNAGEEANDLEDVIVSTSYDSTGAQRFGSISDSLKNASVTGTSADSGGKKLKLSDNNVTPVGAEKKAENEYMMSRLNADSGTIEIVGDPRVKPMDKIRLNNTPRASSIGDGDYTAQSVTHTFSAKNGFTTKVGLTVDIESAFSDLFDRNTEVTDKKPVERGILYPVKVAYNRYFLPEEAEDESVWDVPGV